MSGYRHSKQGKLSQIVILAIVVGCGVLSLNLAAQAKVKRPAKFSPQGSDDLNLVWKKPKPIERKTVPKGGAHRKIETVPLLTMRWQVLFKKDIDESCKPLPVDAPNHKFVNHDLLRLALEVNQKGYLYVIGHTESGTGKIIDAPKQINLGQNKTLVDFKQVLPATCPDESARCGDCYWEISDPAGLDIITVIFSREQIPQLMNPANESRVVSDSFIKEMSEKAGGSVRQLWEMGKQNSAQSGVVGQYVYQVGNPNVKNNELLVARIELNHP